MQKLYKKLCRKLCKNCAKIVQELCRNCVEILIYESWTRYWSTCSRETSIGSCRTIHVTHSVYGGVVSEPPYVQYFNKSTYGKWIFTRIDEKGFRLRQKKSSRLRQTSGCVCGKGMKRMQKSSTCSYRCPFDLHNHFGNFRPWVYCSSTLTVFACERCSFQKSVPKPAEISNYFSPLVYCPAVCGHFLNPLGNHPRGAIFLRWIKSINQA